MSQSTECNAINIDPAQAIANEILDGPAIIFSGQGSQSSGMGRELAENSKEAMACWKQAEAISGLPLREIYWEGDDLAMSDTAALQPALTVTNFNMWRDAEKRHGIQPCACAGHSLGEFGALAACGALAPEDAIKITALRGKLMAEADPEGKGGMAAIVKLGEKEVLEIVESAGRESGELIVAANYNTPSQIVVSGTKKAIALACQKAKAMKGRSIELKVSGAFHSPLMAEANRQLAPLLEKVTWHDPRFPFYANVDAKPVITGEGARKSILRQMISPVFWVNLIRSLYIAGVRWWMEISPRAVLGKMIGPSLAGIAGQCDILRVDLLNALPGIF